MCVSALMCRRVLCLWVAKEEKRGLTTHHGQVECGNEKVCSNNDYGQFVTKLSTTGRVAQNYVSPIFRRPLLRLVGDTYNKKRLSMDTLGQMFDAARGTE
jgi:hypothetical protein